MTGGLYARVDQAAVASLLALTLVLPGIVGGPTPFVIDVVALIALIWVVGTGRAAMLFATLAARLFLAAVLCLVILFAITAETPLDLSFIVNFVPLVLFAPMVVLLGTEAGTAGAQRVARLSLLGAAIVALVAFLLAVVLQLYRADAGLFSPITLTNTAMMLGFIAIGGIWHDTGRRRWIYLLGPVFGVACAILTGSRGPLLAVLPLGLIAALFLARQLRVRASLALAALAVATVVLLAVMQLFPERIGSMIELILGVLRGEETLDKATATRLDLYQAGLHAFADSPIIGHGWAELMSATRQYLSPVYALDVLPQIHNDLLNFLVAAGVIGAAVYLVIVATPLAGAFASPRDSQRSFRLYATSVILIAYLFDGLTDIMIGFEFHTTYISALAAIVLGYCRDPAPNLAAT